MTSRLGVKAYYTKAFTIFKELQFLKISSNSSVRIIIMCEEIVDTEKGLERLHHQQYRLQTEKSRLLLSDIADNMSIDRIKEYIRTYIEYCMLENLNIHYDGRFFILPDGASPLLTIIFNQNYELAKLLLESYQVFNMQQNLLEA